MSSQEEFKISILNHDLDDTEELDVYVCMSESTLDRNARKESPFYSKDAVKYLIGQILEKKQPNITKTQAFKTYSPAKQIIELRHPGNSNTKEMERRLGGNREQCNERIALMLPPHLAPKPKLPPKPKMPPQKRTPVVPRIDPNYPTEIGGVKINADQFATIYAAVMSMPDSKYDEAQIKTMITVMADIPNLPRFYATEKIPTLMSTFRDDPNNQLTKLGARLTEGELGVAARTRVTELMEQVESLREADISGGYGYGDRKKLASITSVSQSLESMRVSASVESQGLRTGILGSSPAFPGTQVSLNPSLGYPVANTQLRGQPILGSQCQQPFYTSPRYEEQSSFASPSPRFDEPTVNSSDIFGWETEQAEFLRPYTSNPAPNLGSQSGLGQADVYAGEVGRLPSPSDPNFEAWFASTAAERNPDSSKSSSSLSGGSDQLKRTQRRRLNDQDTLGQASIGQRYAATGPEKAKKDDQQTRGGQEKAKKGQKSTGGSGDKAKKDEAKGKKGGRRRG